MTCGGLSDARRLGVVARSMITVSKAFGLSSLPEGAGEDTGSGLPMMAIARGTIAGVSETPAE
jgi:hypothetical protein